MPMIWNAEAEAKLLAAIVKTSDGIQFKPAEIARYMGPECTSKAVSHRITQIKKLVESLVPDEEAGPTANGNGTTSTTPKTPKSNNKKRGAANGDAGGSPTPAKKARTPKGKGKGKGKKGAAEVKEEDAEVKEEDAENGEKIKSESETGASGDGNADDA